jgi:hypothetical protein
MEGGRMTKTLTEQWRAGNLKKSFYYLKFPDTETAEIYNLYDMEKFRYVQDSEKIDVIDEVPSYDEYKQLVSKTEQLQKNLEVSEKAHYKTLEQLRIATKALEYCADENKDGDLPEEARQALKEMEWC